MGILSAIFGLFGSGGLVSNVAKALGQAYADKQNATTEQARIAADERIHALEQQAAAIEGKQASWFLALPQWVMGMSLALYVAKVFVYDFVLGLGVTGELKGNTWIIATTILGGYFLLKIVRG